MSPTMFTLDEAAYGRLPYSREARLHARWARALPARRRNAEARRRPRAQPGSRRNLARPRARRRRELLRRRASRTASSRTCARTAGRCRSRTSRASRCAAREPLQVAYRGRAIATPPPPAGGIMVAEMLRILERFDLVALDHNGPEYIRVVAEAMKIAGARQGPPYRRPRFRRPRRSSGCCRTPTPKNARRASRAARRRTSRVERRLQAHHDRLLHRPRRHGGVADPYATACLPASSRPAPASCSTGR